MFIVQFYFGKLAVGYCSLWASQKAPGPHPQEDLFLSVLNKHRYVACFPEQNQVTLYLAFMQNFMLQSAFQHL